MKTFKCDLCGIYYEPYEQRVYDLVCNTITISSPRNDLPPTLKASESYDVCRDCLTAFMQFLWDRRHLPEKRTEVQRE